MGIFERKLGGYGVKWEKLIGMVVGAGRVTQVPGAEDFLRTIFKKTRGGVLNGVTDRDGSRVGPSTVRHKKRVCGLN